eukprot:Amastigsp_a1203_22.p6 type:complete len:119 gc:universal Amastigsp_a1203_22:1979-1623(-)
MAWESRLSFVGSFRAIFWRTTIRRLKTHSVSKWPWGAILPSVFSTSWTLPTRATRIRCRRGLCAGLTRSFASTRSTAAALLRKRTRFATTLFERAATLRSPRRTFCAPTRTISTRCAR